MIDVEKRVRGRPPSFDRATVVAAAMRVFWAAGYEVASLPMLTAAMGISAQSLYAAFGSKEALYREAMAMYRATDGGFPAAALEEADAITAVQRLLRDAATAFSNKDTPGCMIAAAPAGGTDDALSAYGRALRRDGVKRVADRLARGIADGQVRGDADPAAWARFIGGIVQGLSSQARDGEDPAELAATAAVAGQALASLRP